MAERGRCGMTDKEFKRLSRAQLIEIIYQLQLQVEELTEQKQALEAALADKRLRINNAGDLARAALEINECFVSAQNAAEQYLNEIKEMHQDAVKQAQKPPDAPEPADSVLDELDLEELLDKYWQS